MRIMCCRSRRSGRTAEPSFGSASFCSAKRGDAAGEINARYGHGPGFGFHTHVSDQHGPHSVRVMSGTKGPYVLDGLMHRDTALRMARTTPTPAARPITALSSAPCWASGTPTREPPRARAAETWMASVVLPDPPFALPRVQTDAGTLAAKGCQRSAIPGHARCLCLQNSRSAAWGSSGRVATTGGRDTSHIDLPESPAAISTACVPHVPENAASPPTKPARPPADPDAVQALENGRVAIQ